MAVDGRSATISGHRSGALQIEYDGSQMQNSTLYVKRGCPPEQWGSPVSVTSEALHTLLQGLLWHESFGDLPPRVFTGEDVGGASIAGGGRTSSVDGEGIGQPISYSYSDKSRYRSSAGEQAAIYSL